MISRHSSRRTKLDQSFINKRLNGAISYDRIAGFFRSSMLEVAGEQIEAIDGIVRVICNTDLQPQDVETAKAAQQAMRCSWCAGKPENTTADAQLRFRRLYDFLVSGKLQVKVLPDEAFGLIHGKAGVITYANGSQTCFIGSANESLTAWKLNYELVWEDDSEQAVNWVQEEFDALWQHPMAMPLADFVIQDIGRIGFRKELDFQHWQQPEQNNPASPIVEMPIYRKEYGLWAHQKAFVKLAFEAHCAEGARFVLADQVGLGKTVQLALAAMLMALKGDKPILVLVPKPLVLQWQDELRELLALPCAIWTGKAWLDEQGIEHPVSSSDAVKKCPRRIGIISQGLITSGSDIVNHLKSLRYECVIVDEAHRSRRRRVNDRCVHEHAEPNKLMAFLGDISNRTKSLLLATATPVQLHPVEAWDLLGLLANGNDFVLGNVWSEWRNPANCLPLIQGREAMSELLADAWNWIRNPLPPGKEHPAFAKIRRSLAMDDSAFVAPGDALDKLSRPDHTQLRRISDDFARYHNPFIRHIVRRTRQYLEDAIDPETGEPYLKPVSVKLFGESEDDAIHFPPYLRDAYQAAEDFTQALSQRVRGGGFFKTLLLRRIGSSIYAGRQTVEKLLNEWNTSDALYEEEDDAIDSNGSDSMKDLTPTEQCHLQRCLKALDANQERDPKYQKVVDYLIHQSWIDYGCIIFSQYFDSVWWLTKTLSKEQLPSEPIGIYAGAGKSGIMLYGQFKKTDRDNLKQQVRNGQIRLLVGTDAASEGLNLQRLGTLINLDLPWNPTRLEQRKGRIQRIGQLRDEVYVYNMRYRGSVEDRVHQLLSSRLQEIFSLFGQIPDVLEDTWVLIAEGEIDEAKKLIASVKPTHPFDEKYSRVESIDWESCREVLSASDVYEQLVGKW